MELDKDSVQMLNAVLQNTPSIPDEELAGAVQHKKHAKPKKKDSSLLCGNEITDIIKSNHPPEEKLKMVCNKYSEVLHANRKLMMAYKMSEGKMTKLQQENELCQQQRSKAVLQRSRLENLCRELQKLNKAQKEEIDLKLRLEEEKRKEISATFQSAFAEMSTLTSQNTEKNTKMREENLEMQEKIKFVRERIELSEQQLQKVRQQSQLELQLAEAKMAALKMEMTAEKEHLLKEKQQLLLKLTEYQVKISELQATEVGLRSQINMYTEKYDDFQNALAKSNEVFNGFNEEMEKMTKKNAKLEKETNIWKQRWEKSHVALLEMAADKQSRDAELEKLNHKLTLLQELCKAFQRERAELLAQLRASKTVPSQSQEEKTAKEDVKAEEQLPEDCQKLKNDLDQLQQTLDEEKSRPKPVKTNTETNTSDDKVCAVNNGEIQNIQQVNPTNEETSNTQEVNNQPLAESVSVVPEKESNINEEDMEPKCEVIYIIESNQTVPVTNTACEELKCNKQLIINPESSTQNQDDTIESNKKTDSINSLVNEPCADLSPKESNGPVKSEELLQSPSDINNVKNVVDTENVVELNHSEVDEISIKNNEGNSSNTAKEKIESSTKQNHHHSSKKGKDGKRKK
ncbi:alpha-taxilin [Chelonus insularis]|uniref:alpha-taxilin n=1 Tax=Chelonus insularis TaxID=460826 RepID=UPI001589A229|nr:alpha-taxilin [Chelonus insularis]XP_034939497.1 alpha-taxilin [Chelonus insularis]XP_034939498.1 alpha-taxilin [Chelonus insularis]XP_034939500.1 alpha-taxilin [Chelonus insularis]XP_034939501.1 alpha-taxilin [Chelonus insularis]